MPVKWLLGPKGERIEFADAPAWFEERGIMPSYAIRALLRDLDYEGSFNVRPSDVNLKFTCRRKRVWEASHEYGINPLELEAMQEGSAIHKDYEADEIVTPANGERIEVCGVPTRGRIDWLNDVIEDLKTSSPYWTQRYGPKGSGLKWMEVWEFDPAADIKTWQVQLSIYRILRLKEGLPTPDKGRVWRRWSGVKADCKTPRWRRFDFDLLDEAGLETEVGPWMRELAVALKAAETDEAAWKKAAPDGLQMIGSRGNYYQCDKCACRSQCQAVSQLPVF